jgi:heme exporter protein D
MSVPAVVWLAVGLSTLLVLVALVLGLVRQVKALAGALAEFQREVGPVLQEMRDGAERARRHAERLQHTDPGFPRRTRR